MKKNLRIDLAAVAKTLGTKVHKTDTGLSHLVKLKTPTVKGVLYDDGSGGLSLQVPSFDCFTSSGQVLEQIADLEETIAAYIALKPDVKKLKAAIKAAQVKAPVNPKVKVKTNVKRRTA